MQEILNSKRCSNSNCSERVMVRGPNEEEYIQIEHRNPEDSALRERIYYHVDCAPIDATRIPEELRIE